MLKGNQKRRKGRLSPPKLATSDSEDETSSSNMLLDINDEDLRRYLQICPKEIIKQDADMLNLRKSLVQRNFLFGAQFTSSTPARIVPGVFNKSSVISPILRQRRFEEKDASSSSKSTLETAAHRSSHPCELVPVSTGRGEISHGRWDDSLLSSLESPDAHKRPPRQRHNGGRVRRNSQKLKCTGKTTPNKKAQDESHDAHKKSSTQRRNAVLRTVTTRSSHKLEMHRRSSAERDESFSELQSEAADVYKGAATQQSHRRLPVSPQKQKSVVAHSADCERSSSESASILKISPAPGSHRRPSMSPSKETSIRAHSSVCETPGKSSSESEPTLNGSILMKRHSRIALENSGRGINKSLAKEKSIRAHLQVPPNPEGRIELPLESELVSRKLENSALGRRRNVSASPVKGRSTRTPSQDDCKKQKRPAEAKTDDEFREPVSGQKRRSNARTDDDTSSSKRGRTQASEVEPIPEANRRRSPRFQSKTTETCKEKSVIFLKPRSRRSVSASPVKGRSTRTPSQDDCEKQKRPAEAKTDDEFREPVNGQKRRSNARTDDDTSSSIRDRTQASELEPIPASNQRRSPRCQSKTTETVTGNCVIFLEPHGDAQPVARNHADKTPDEGRKRKENERLPASSSVGNEASGKPHNYTWMINAYDKHFDTSPQFDSHISDISDNGELSVNPVDAPNVPSVGEVSCFERNDVDTRPSCGNSFARKANNLNAVITYLASSSSNGPKQTKRAPPCEILNAGAKAKRRQKTAAKNKAEDIENVVPARRITNKEKDTNKQKRTGTKVQKGGNVVTTNDTTSEEPTGCRRSTRERKQRDLALPGIVIYMTHDKKPAVRKPKKNTERNKSNARVQSKKVKTTDRGGRRGKRNTVQPSLLGSSGGTNESRDAQAPRLTEENDGSESETESQLLSGGDFFKDDAPSSSLPIEEERAQRRKTKHLNLRVNNSLLKIEWFGDDTLALDDLESDTSGTTNMRMMHTIGVPTVATSGYIAIGPSVTKPSQLSKKYHLMFYVMKGTAQVCVQDRFYTGGPNCRFFIPFGYEYSISNLSAKKKLVLFCVRIPP